MRLLLTRSEPEAAETAATLRALGHDVLVQPMLEIVLLPPPVVSKPPGLIVTSRNGLRALETWPAAAGWRDLPVFAVGDETARAIREAGFSSVRSASGSSDDLAALIIKEWRLQNGPLLYVAAAERSGDLDQKLLFKGYDLTLAIAYRADPAAALDPAVRAALAEHGVDGILVFSRRAAERLGEVVMAAKLREALGEVAVFALSNKVALGLSRLAVGRFHVPRSPDAESLIGLIPPPKR